LWAWPFSHDPDTMLVRPGYTPSPVATKRLVSLLSVQWSKLQSTAALTYSCAASAQCRALHSLQSVEITREFIVMRHGFQFFRTGFTVSFTLISLAGPFVSTITQAKAQTGRGAAAKKREGELKSVYKKWVEEEVAEIITEDERR